MCKWKCTEEEVLGIEAGAHGSTGLDRPAASTRGHPRPIDRLEQQQWIDRKSSLFSATFKGLPGIDSMDRSPC